MRAPSALAVRPGEGRIVALLCGLFASIEAARGVGEVAYVTLFLTRVGPSFLPYLYIALGAVSLVVALGYGVGLGRLPRRPFLVGLLIAFAATLVVLRLVLVSGAPLAFGVLGVAINVVNTILLTLVWTIASTALDARQAKRLFPLCTSAAIAGGFVGTLAAGPLTALIGPENLILLVAGLLVIAAGFASQIGSRTARAARAPAGGNVSLLSQLRAGFDDVRRSPLLRLVAVAYVLFAALMFSLQFPYQTLLADEFAGNDAALATFVGLVQAAVTAASFVVSIALANRVYARFGVVTAAMVLPVVYLLGFGTWLVLFTLATAVAVTFTQQVVQRSLSNAAWSALFTVVPSERRPQVLAFMDGVPGQLGVSLSGVLLLTVGAIAAASLTPVFVLGLAAAVVCTWVVIEVRRRYGAALVQTLRAGLGEQVLEGGPGLAAIGRDQALSAELVAALADPMPAVRAMAADLLGRLGESSSADALEPLLVDDDPAVRAAAVRAMTLCRPTAGRELAARLENDAATGVRAELAVALATSGDTDAAEALIDALLASDEPGDRAAALAAAARSRSPRLAALSTAGLGDPSPWVRAAAAEAFTPALHAEGTDEPAALALLIAALDDDVLSVRRAAAQTLAGHDLAAKTLVEVLENGSERAQEAAVRGLEGTGDEAFEPVRAWARERVARMTRLRIHAAALGSMSASADASNGANDGASLDFLRGIIDRRGHRTEAQLLTAVATLGAPEASGLLRRSLRAPDPDVRAQAIEAIDALGDRELGRDVVRLLDTDLPSSREATDEALRMLGEDPDPWIRALAMRAQADRMTHTYAALLERATSDPDPIVRATAATMPAVGGPPVTETSRTLGELDRMVVLRRVPLFSQLDPEDLQRIAVTAQERLYPSGEALVREGDVGDELIVIVEGSVRISKRDGDTERFVRTYEAGDHIGELAVLRDQPRAATVVAEQDVRGLCIGGEALRAILQERPEAAMAMLATLAERISSQ
jgi:HEAT repeat protein/ATP/ADP translocase